MSSSLPEKIDALQKARALVARLSSEIAIDLGLGYVPMPEPKAVPVPVQALARVPRNGKKRKRVKVTPQMKSLILTMLRAKTKAADIAAKVGVTKSTVYLYKQKTKL